MKEWRLVCMKYTEQVQQMLENYILHLSKPALFIKHYDIEDFNKADFIQLLPEVSSVECMYHKYTAGDLYEAYEPFLNWIREFYQKYYANTQTAEDFLKACNIYSLHVEPFATYLRDAYCQRKEDVMYKEINFEKHNIITDLIHILRYIAQNRKLIFILCAFHLAPQSSIHLLLQILKLSVSNLHFIIVYNDSFYPKAYIKNTWDALTTYIKDENMLIEWGKFTSEITMNSVADYEFQSSTITSCIQKLNNMYQLFALEDMEYYITNVYNTIFHNLHILDERDVYEILVLYTNLRLGKGDIEAAIMASKIITNLSLFHTDLRVAYQYYYLTIKTQMNSGHMDIIKHSYNKCLTIAEQLQDDFLVFLAKLLYCMAQFGGWRDLFLCDFRIPVSKELLTQAETFHYWNHLAYLYTMGFENDEESIRAIATGEQNSYYFTKGVQLAKSLGNSDFLMSAYMKNIIIYSDAGYHEYVYQMHKKRIETVKSDDKILQAHMYLGIGYNCIILEKYDKADLYFREALHNLAYAGEADNCMDALYNICMNFFVIEDYESVIPCIDVLLKMLEALGYQHLMVCNTAKLYGMLAVSYFHLHDYYNTYHYLAKIDTYVHQFLDREDPKEFKYWEEEIFLYHYIKALLFSYEENYTACQTELDLSYRYLWLLPGTIFYTYSLYTCTQAQIYDKQGFTEKRDTLMQNAIQYYKHYGFFSGAKKLQCIWKHQSYEKYIVAFNEPDLLFDKLLSLANYEGTKNKLKYREKDIAFLTIWQENLNRSEHDTKILLENAVTIMQNSYSLSDVVILKQKNGMPEILYNNSPAALSTSCMKDIFAFFRQYKRGFLTHRTDKNFLQFMPIIQPFDEKRVVTMLGIPISAGDTECVLLSHVSVQRNFTGNRVLLTSENLVTLKFAFSQLVDTLHQINANNLILKMNEKLEKMSITDYLTNLYNRHGMNYLLDQKIAPTEDSTMLILYIDLDNFKYYNDTFGHEIGDCLLVHFAEILKGLIYKKGYAIRYGGDEFVLMLPNLTEDDGLAISNQIYEAMADGCRELLLEKTGLDFDIPSDKKLSCSIGITVYSGTSHTDMERALNNADQSLYFIKRNSKGHAMTWSRLKDFVQTQ